MHFTSCNPQGNGTTILRISTLAIFSLGLLLLAPSAAIASHDLRSETEFIAWSADLKHHLVRIRDENRGTMLAIKQLGKVTPVHEQTLDGADEAELLQHPFFAQYKFTDAGVPASPHDLMILGSAQGAQFVLFLSNGEKMTRIMGIPLGTDAAKTRLATATVKQTVWSTNGAVAAVIIHQSLEAEHGLFVDQLVSFPIAPYAKKLQAAEKQEKEEKEE